MDKDVFAWARHVGCPSEFFNRTVQRTLCEGLFALLWDEMSKATFSANQVTSIRKNILLYKLQKNRTDATIQSMKEIAQLRIRINKTNEKIGVLEEECDKSNFLFRKKVQRIGRVKSSRVDASLRRDLLGLRCNEARVQINDCANMRHVCRKIMPNTEINVDKELLDLCLNKMATLETKSTTKEVWDQVSNMLGCIRTGTLWSLLIGRQSEDLTKLTKLNLTNEMDRNNVIGEKIELGIARASGQHVHMFCKKLLHDARNVSQQRHLIEWINKIEMATSNARDTSEWLAVALEVEKLATERINLQSEIDGVKASWRAESTTTLRLAELASDIRQIDSEIERYIQSVKESLIRLKSAPLQIMAQKEKLHYELEKILTLGTNNRSMEWSCTRLAAELNVFREISHVNVLRKVMLKGEVGSYRHISSCLSECPISVMEPDCTKTVAHFPTIKIPIYTLMNCYREAITKTVYKRRLQVTPTRDLELAMLSTSGECDIYRNVLDLLNLTQAICNNAQREMQHFYNIFKAWTNQNGQEMLIVADKKMVHGATFHEWIQRYRLLLYVQDNYT